MQKIAFVLLASSFFCQVYVYGQGYTKAYGHLAENKEDSNLVNNEKKDAEIKSEKSSKISNSKHANNADSDIANSSATKKQTQKIQENSNPLQDFTMQHKIAKISSVVVVSSWKNDLFTPASIDLYGKDTPLHSGDLAKSMLLIPGFSMSRKGGAGSEIFFRSQGASRMPIFLNGGVLNGACGGRMDTITTYTFPENYNRISIYKGPQDVRYGALIAGGVLFDRDITRLQNPNFSGSASVLYGSFKRLDVNANAMVGNKYGSLQAIISHYSSDDYIAGGGIKVHSAYNRESASIIGTITPSENTALELDMDMGNGFASYADRSMDARTFDRISYNLKYQQHFSGIFDLLDIRAWYNGIDHIMDNFSYRPVTNGKYSLSNPKRTNIGTRIEGKLFLNDMIELYVGGNYNHDFNELRMGSGANANEANAALNSSYGDNFLFESAGLFTQGSYLDSDFGIFFGGRYDYVYTLQYSTLESLNNNLGSAFGRYEKYFNSATLYAGLGVAERAADFWERSKSGGMDLSPETNIQMDMGTLYKQKDYNVRASAFFSFMPNYIVLYYGDTMNATTSTFNTNAMLFGGEIEGEYILLDSVHFYGSMSYTYGQNLSTYYGDGYTLRANSPLPQIAPLQGQVSIFYNKSGWFLRFDTFFNAAQHRYALNFGNVVGKDFGSSKGFAVFNLYGGYQFKQVQLLAGVDNLADTLYAYYLSKSGASIAALGIEPTSRVYEPGRYIWVKIKATF